MLKAALSNRCTLTSGLHLEFSIFIFELFHQFFVIAFLFLWFFLQLKGNIQRLKNGLKDYMYWFYHV